jgi:hypothetical protein
MADRTAPVDAVALVAALEQLERRVESLERALALVGPLPTASALPVPDTAPVERAEAPPAEWAPVTVVTLVGRTLIALGGAYLLRALTESATIPPALGVVVGFLYAQLWLTLCSRAGLRGERPSAVFHGLTAALVAFPLVWETTARFGLVNPTMGALLVGVGTGLMFAVARLSRMQAIAWFGAVGGTVTALALAPATSAFVPYTVLVACIGVAALWLGYVDDWVGLRWPVAGAANLLVLAITIRALDPDAAPAVPVVVTVAVQMFVLAIYLGSFVGRTLVLGREVVPFEIAQSAAVMAVSFGGALLVLSSARVSALPLGLAALAAGAGAYAFSFLYVERRRQWRNLAFFTSLAVGFSLAGVVVVAAPAAAALIIGALALLCAEWARRSARLTLAVHATVFAGAMVWITGLAGAATFALGAPASAAWPALDAGMLLALATVAASVAWPAPPALAWLETPAARAFRLSRMTLFVWVAAGIAVSLAVRVLSGVAPVDAGVIATLRTVVLVAAATALLWLPRPESHVERSWLAIAVLGLLALKFVAEDLPRGRPATLFVALAVYGAALVIAPRLARRPPRVQGVTPGGTHSG